MRLTRSWTAKRLRGLVSLLYLTVVAAVPVAHAAVESGSVAVRAENHLHAPGTDCPPTHDEQHCPVCQVAGLRTLPGHRTPILLGAAEVRWDAAPLPRFFPPQHPVRSPGPRAPPLA